MWKPSGILWALPLHSSNRLGWVGLIGHEMVHASFCQLTPKAGIVCRQFGSWKVKVRQATMNKPSIRSPFIVLTELPLRCRKSSLQFIKRVGLTCFAAFSLRYCWYNQSYTTWDISVNTNKIMGFDLWTVAGLLLSVFRWTDHPLVVRSICREGYPKLGGSQHFWWATSYLSSGEYATRQRVWCWSLPVLSGDVLGGFKDFKTVIKYSTSVIKFLLHLTAVIINIS